MIRANTIAHFRGNFSCVHCRFLDWNENNPIPSYITNWQILGTFSKDLAFFDYQRKKARIFRQEVTLWLCDVYLDLGP